jgi:hypothetical protein
MSDDTTSINQEPYQLRPIGTVDSPLLDRATAPLQGD